VGFFWTSLTSLYHRVGLTASTSVTYHWLLCLDFQPGFDVIGTQIGMKHPGWSRIL